jgi:hypothetical protein
VGLLSFCAGFAASAADTGDTARVRLIAGLAGEKAYLPRFHAIRALEKESPLSDAERAALLAFLRRTDGIEGTDFMIRQSSFANLRFVRVLIFRTADRSCFTRAHPRLGTRSA